MTENLRFELEENKTYTGVVNATGEETTFSTGASCTAGGACPMNGNTRWGENTLSDVFYYSWYAATANSGTASQVNTEAPYSVCPKGWRLPSSYTISEYRSKSYGNLTQAYLGFSGYTLGDRTQKLASFPLLMGDYKMYRNGKVDNGYGRIWTSTAYTSAEHAYMIFYSTSFTDPYRGTYKQDGYVVRCLSV